MLQCRRSSLTYNPSTSVLYIFDLGFFCSFISLFAVGIRSTHCSVLVKLNSNNNASQLAAEQPKFDRTFGIGFQSYCERRRRRRRRRLLIPHVLLIRMDKPHLTYGFWLMIGNAESNENLYVFANDFENSRAFCDMRILCRRSTFAIFWNTARVQLMRIASQSKLYTQTNQDKLPPFPSQCASVCANIIFSPSPRSSQRVRSNLHNKSTHPCCGHRSARRTLFLWHIDKGISRWTSH